MLSVEYSGEPKSGPYAFTFGKRRSEAMRSCRYFFGSPHSHHVTTMLRSIPEGRAGLACGSSPLATRSVHSPKYLNGAPPRWPASGRIMLFAAWPDCTRRIHAWSPGVMCASSAGMVRVEAWPSWWQPTHERFLTTVNHSGCVICLGMFVLPPNWLDSGILIIEYQ
jgi:hypothetical protein